MGPLNGLIRRHPYLALLGLATIIAVGAWLLLRGRPPRLSPGALGAEQEITGADRILIVAPHSDDETLGAGGLLHDAVVAGADVCVIMVTNGDGFRYAVEAERLTLRPSPATYIQFAYQRQLETLAAVRLLGLAPENVTFLGYPDRGIAYLWSANWARSSPYRSRFTGLTNSPYTNSFTPNAAYAGEQLADDLTALLQRFRPTLIVFPHPSDAHPDHWAVNAFINYTLQGLRERGEGWATTAKQRLYLVHRGEWPNPKGLRPKLPLLPPKTLVNTQTHWLVRELPDETVTLKHDAILAYHSQVTLMRGYLLSFARENELFGVLDPVPIPLVSAASSGLARVIADPTGDTIARRIESGADIVAVDAGRSASHLYLRVTMRGRISDDATYNLRFVPLGAASSRGHARLDLRYSPPATLAATAPPGVTTAATGSSSGSQIAIAVPLVELGNPGLLYISIDTALAQFSIDRAAWTLCNLGDPPPVVGSGGLRHGVP